MSFGLNRFLKNILPKRLFYRGLLIVAVPIVILQITISLVFFDSLWIKTNKGLTKALVGEIVTIIEEGATSFLQPTKPNGILEKDALFDAAEGTYKQHKGFFGNDAMKQEVKAVFMSDTFKNELQIIIPRNRMHFEKNGVVMKRTSFDSCYFCYKMNLKKDITWL